MTCNLQFQTITMTETYLHLQFKQHIKGRHSSAQFDTNKKLFLSTTRVRPDKFRFVCNALCLQGTPVFTNFGNPWGLIFRTSNGSVKGLRSNLSLNLAQNPIVWSKICHATNLQMADLRIKRFSTQRSKYGDENDWLAVFFVIKYDIL